MEIKKHFKMYKSGKQWCVAALATFAIAAGGILSTSTAHADTTTTSQVASSAVITSASASSATTSQVASNNSASSSNVNSNQTSVNANSVVNASTASDTSAVAMSTVAASAVKSDSQTMANSAATLNSEAQPAREVEAAVSTPTSAHFETKDGKVYYYDSANHMYQDQWYENWGNKYYFGSDGARVTSSTYDTKDPEGTYYFDNQGIMKTDYFLTQNGKVYYFGKDGKEYKDQFYSNWGNMYYFGSDGARYTNQYYTNWGNTYYFGEGGVRYTDRFVSNDGKMYYYDKNGVRLTNQWYEGWGNKYYFGADSARVTSSTYDIDGATYYFDNLGVMKTDYFLTQNGKVYYFGKDGKEYKKQFYTNWGHTYYFGDDGARYTNQFYQNWGHTYYFGSDGARWDNRFYSNWGHVYYFGNDGARWDNRFYSNWGNTYYFGSDGARWDNRFMVRWGNAYYFGNDGALVKNQNRNIDGTNYSFDGQGVISLRNQFLTANENQLFYFDSQGKLLTNSFYNNWGNSYYFGSDGARYTDQFLTKDNNTYYFGDGGVMAKGKTQLDSKWYYFDPSNGVMAKSRVVEIDGIGYGFDKDGVLLSGVTTDKDGNVYYIDGTTGKVRTNFLLEDNGKWIYFNASDGKGSDALKLQFQSGTVSVDQQFANGNQAYDYTNDSIQNVNGYLTADTWYRPKQILKDGTTWTDSTATDLRPLLMVWWPSKDIQVDYLNYMKKNGLITTSEDYSSTDSDSTLSYAVDTVQENVEKKISQKGSTDWLKTLMSDFVKTESIWNQDSENVSYNGLQLQGGFLKYVNSDLTSYANSNYRYLGWTADNVLNGDTTPGQPKSAGSEFLLANDIDNSNPVVQAEQLNWLYYLTNFGTITDNDPGANFDSIRVDAVDNVDIDLLTIAGDYFRQAYGIYESDAKANAHINILEDWNGRDPYYANSIGNPQLTLDNTVLTGIHDTLAAAPDKVKSLSELISNSLVSRTNNSTENTAIPNYSFVRAHDNGSQDEIRQAISAVTGKSYGVFNFEDEQKGIAAYIEDQNSTTKKWNKYNIPASYAYILTNKDTIPRIYYGDLYTDGGQYMAQETRYYPTITNMMKARIKYVSGGQTLNYDDNTGVLTSVRFGKGAMTASDKGTAETRTEGIGVIISNDTGLSLKNGSSVVLHMGAAHANQKYRALVLTTADGVQNFTSDQGAPVAYTDANGDLYFYGTDLITSEGTQANTAIKGYANPDVTGYLAIWVPAGAADNQDARTAASTDAHTKDEAYRSNAALDSNVIFEGFSNFVYYPTTDSEKANVKIAQNADFFKSIGITSFEMAPQYVSSKDGSFLDSQIDNGYAFTDRYDLGMSTASKYGTAEDLRNAIKALHKAGLQAMADWVPDQIYNLPGEEAVTTTRAEEHGITWEISQLKDKVYIANTIGGGEYQKKYGGAFLEELQKLYPAIFQRVQISTGKTIDPSTKITEWSAKYFNGTNILKRGVGYVLQGDGGQYYNLGSATTKYLPVQLTGPTDASKNGFVKGNDGNYHYYNESGEELKDGFVQDATGNWYYFDKNGNMVANKRFVDVTVDGSSATYLFLNNGVSFRSGLVQTADGTYYFDANGRMVRNQVVSDGAMTYTLDGNGKLVKKTYDPNAETPHPVDISKQENANK